MDYEDFNDVNQCLQEAQDAEEDMRALAKDALVFITKQGGQWEPDRWSDNQGKPRYTFDQTTPIVDQIAGDLDDSDFDVKVSPADGSATKEGAELIDGIIRNIERLSEARHIYSDAARNMVTSGIDHWMVETDYVNSNSFDQEIKISPIFNSCERVWFDTNSHKIDRSDAKYGFLLSAIATKNYYEEFPEGSGQSVSTDDNNDSVYYNKPDQVIIGHFYYCKEIEFEIVETKLGRVFEYNEAFKLVEDALAEEGETIEQRRTRMKKVFCMRKFDGSGWLTDPVETVFETIPIVPVYGNYKVIENKPTYHGAVLKLMDAQRVLNYSMSREIEEGALAPRAKYWMTRTQASGNEAQLSTLNTNSDPVQFYTHDAEAPQVPMQQGGAQINQGLRAISEGMMGVMSKTAGIFAAGMGDNPDLQSGVAIGKLQDKANNITTKYFSSMEKAIAATARLLGQAIPKVYDNEREIQIVKPDGALENTILNQNDDNGEMNNVIGDGQYAYTCTSSPSFDSRQTETVNAITELAQYDPTLLQMSSDVLLNNINAPSIDKIAERKRIELLIAGIIPQTQQTAEEQQMLAMMAQQQANQPQEPSAEMALAQAEQAKAQAALERNQIAAQKDQMEAQFKMQKNQLDLQRQEIELEEKKAKLQLSANDQRFQQAMEAQQLALQKISEQIENMNVQADTAVKIDSIRRD